MINKYNLFANDWKPKFKINLGDQSFAWGLKHLCVARRMGVFSW